MAGDGTGWPRARSRDGGVDRIPLPGSPGTLWLCGKHAIGPDVEALVEHYDITTVVCLTERFELIDRYPAYIDWLDANVPTRAMWFPIPDLDAPPVAAVVELLDDLRRRLDAGERLMMHCAAGIGRAGTTAVCLLITLGHTPDEAERIVREHRPMAGPEAGSQRDLVTEIARLASDD